MSGPQNCCVIAYVSSEQKIVEILALEHPSVLQLKTMESENKNLAYHGLGRDHTYTLGHR